MSSSWFVAWPVVTAGSWYADLIDQAPGGLRLFDPEDLHVTLAFMGTFKPELERKLISLLRGLPFREIDASGGRLIPLPQPRRFSALALTLDKGRIDTTGQIARWRDRLCRESGAKIESGDPLPHLTIARPEKKIGSDGRGRALDWAESLKPTGFEFRLTQPRIFVRSNELEDRQFRLLPG